MKTRVLLKNYYLPGDLERQIGAFVACYNTQLYLGNLGNLTPADDYFGRTEQIRKQQQEIKQKTMLNQCLRYQTENAYPEKPRVFANAQEVREAVLDTLPEAKETPMLVMPSSSSMICDEVSGEMISCPGGWRVLLSISDASAVPWILEVLHLRCWARSKGSYAYVDKGGAIQVRSIADQALARPTQPDYPKADLGRGLKRATDTAEMFDLDGKDLDPSGITLTQEERNAAQRNIAEAKTALKDKATEVREECISNHVQELEDRGVSSSNARKAADARYEQGLLIGSDHVNLEGRPYVAVADLLGPRGADLDGRLCADPIEPDYDGGRLVGKFYWNNGRRPGIHSFARGGRFVALRHSPESATAAIFEAAGDKDRIVCILALLCADELETDLALKEACKALNLGNKTKALKDAVQRHRDLHGISGMQLPHDDASTELEGAVVPRGTALVPGDFPHVRPVSDENVRPIDHLENVECLLDRYGFSFHYNQILKEIEWSHPELDSSGDNADEQLYAELVSLCSKNYVPSRSLAAHMIAIADRRAINPVTDYLRALEWDGGSRFGAVMDAFDTEDQEILLIAMRIFLIQACAAADHASEAALQNSNYVPSFESVIVFLSEQGRGKTKGFKRFIPEQLRRYHKEGVELDPRNKDSVKKAVSAWIVELGELDGTFRKADIAALKAHLSTGVDELRMPYARTASKFQRRTVFIGTVNEEQFLADGTGNRRFLPIKTDHVRVNWSAAEIDQLWAEAWSRYVGGEQWWPTEEEEERLADHTDKYRSRSWIEESLGTKFDWDAPISNDLKRKSATDIFSDLQINGHSHAGRPSQKDLKDVGQCMKRRWARHPQVRKRGGNLYLELDGVEHKIHHEGGKTNGWLVPPPTTKCTPQEIIARINTAKKAL